MSDEIDADVLRQLREREETAKRMTDIRNARLAAALIERRRIVQVIERVRPYDPELARLIECLPDIEGI